MVDCHIVKRDARVEQYYPEKLYQSIRAACLSVRTPEGSAETTARHVTHKVELWLKNKQEVTSADVRRTATTHLQTYDPDAAYLYNQYQKQLP